MDAEKRLTTNSALEELGCPHTEREHEALTLGLRIRDENDPLLFLVASALHDADDSMSFTEKETAAFIRTALLSGNGGKDNEWVDTIEGVPVNGSGSRVEPEDNR